MEMFTLLTILFFITASVVVLDNRLIRAKKMGEIPFDEPSLPPWVAVVYWVWIGLALALLFINWEHAIYVFIAFVLLSFFGILEIAGNILMSPFNHRNKKNN